MTSLVFPKNYSYAQYLSFATLVSYVAHVGAMLFQRPLSDFCADLTFFFGGGGSHKAVFSN